MWTLAAYIKTYMFKACYSSLQNCTIKSILEYIWQRRQKCWTRDRRFFAIKDEERIAYRLEVVWEIQVFTNYIFIHTARTWKQHTLSHCSIGFRIVIFFSMNYLGQHFWAFLGGGQVLGDLCYFTNKRRQMMCDMQVIQKVGKGFNS